MKKCVLLITLSLIFVHVKAQVGIGTENPRTTLDVNGDLNIRKDLKVRGTNSTNGNPGTSGQVLVSSGPNAAPQWKSIKVPFALDGEYQLVSTELKYDLDGINFGQNNNNNSSYNISRIGDPITGTTPSWSQISGLETNILVEQTGNTLNLVFQTGAESNSVGSPTTNILVRYMCGIFQNNELVAFRGDELLDVHRKSTNNYGIYTLSYSVDDLPLGTHNFKVACRRIQTTSGTYQFAIGRTVQNSNVSNNFMMQSILKVELLEPVIYQ